MRAIEISQTGGADVLEYVEAELASPSNGQAVVEVAAAGVNFIDTYHRSGLYPMDLPVRLGLEGAGTVLATGPDSDFTPGDRVAWCSVQGSYAERIVASNTQLARIPDGVDLETAAAAMLQGLTAWYLANDTYPLAEGDTCLVHAGAGGVGHLLLQMAKAKGARVFTTVGSSEKAEIAARHGADHVIDYTTEDFVAAVERIAGTRPIDVIYDGVGKATVERGLSLLATRGMMVTFGNASGAPDPISPLELSTHGSLFLTRPTLFDYIATTAEFHSKTDGLFRLIADGSLSVRVGARFSLDNATDAHRALEGRQTVGKVLLIP